MCVGLQTNCACWLGLCLCSSDPVATLSLKLLVRTLQDLPSSPQVEPAGKPMQSMACVMADALSDSPKQPPYEAMVVTASAKPVSAKGSLTSRGGRTEPLGPAADQAWPSHAKPASAFADDDLVCPSKLAGQSSWHWIAVVATRSTACRHWCEHVGAFSIARARRLALLEVGFLEYRCIQVCVCVSGAHTHLPAWMHMRSTLCLSLSITIICSGGPLLACLWALNDVTDLTCLAGNRLCRRGGPRSCSSGATQWVAFPSHRRCLVILRPCCLLVSSLPLELPRYRCATILRVCLRIVLELGRRHSLA